LCIISLLEKHGRQKNTHRISSENVMLDENMRNIEANTKETARVSGEIERAKREGNVAEEERLKVQLERLVDERVKLDSMRREMELSMGKEHAVFAEGAPRTPGYASSTPVGEEDDAQRVRSAVSSFNEKMLDKYGGDYENIPESPRYEPSSPKYTSMFEGSDQEGGGQRGGGGKFIPQIPMSVLDNYLNSKYGVSPKHITTHSSQISGSSGIMIGGSNTSGGFGVPTMNIPVVATMPMAGMMPIQQDQQQQQHHQAGGGNPLYPQQPGGMQQRQQSGQNTAAQSGAQVGGGNEPNAQGVKTFSIKL
jgi:hypothetical protein